MKPERSRRRNPAEDAEQRRRELIERSITGHGPEAVATRKRLTQSSTQSAAASKHTEEPGRTPSATEGERVAAQNDQQRQPAASQATPKPA